MAEQLSVTQLRVEFRRYMEASFAQELIDFYVDSLDREEITCFFERQVPVSVRLHIENLPGEDILKYFGAIPVKSPLLLGTTADLCEHLRCEAVHITTQLVFHDGRRRCSCIGA